MIDEQVEFQDLLDKHENSSNLGKDNEKSDGDDKSDDEKSWKKRLQVALIHVALLVVSVLYAIFGSMIFYHIESPYEHTAKADGIRRIQTFKDTFVQTMWNNSRSETKQKWLLTSDQGLKNLTELLYFAYKREFVKMHDVLEYRPFNVNVYVNDEPTWTNPSALFFSITTMATIGYGNVVPVTQLGRIICVLFSLFGTPLAIITIGDMGKFVSECIIFVYKKYKAVKKRLGLGKKKKKKRKEHSSETALEDMLNDVDDESSDEEGISYEDILLHRIQVPVILVFGILVLYIALGAILFHVLEGWNYLDSFYFCFISLTTVGFGDLVPKQHKYMTIILLYICFGLAVATMCIDLVGRQYLWKIHYFGRKFKEADLLKLLRRKRMIERRLQNVDIQKLYMEAVEKQMKMAAQQTPPVLISLDSQLTPVCEDKFEQVSPQWQVDNVFPFEEVKVDLNSNSIEQAEISPVSTNPSYYTRLKMFLTRNNRPSVSSPSGPSLDLQCSLSTSPSVGEREQMFQRRLQSNTSWTPSGPDISLQCSLHTSPSVYEREEYYARLPYYPESPEEYLYQFRLPSPDYEQIAKAAKTKRQSSCPSNVVLQILPEAQMIQDALDTISINTLMEESQEASIQQPQLSEDLPISDSDDEQTIPPVLLSPIESSNDRTPLSSPSSSTFDDGFKLPDLTGDSGRASSEPEIVYYENCPVYAVVDKPVEADEALQHGFTCPVKFLSKSPPAVVTENYCFVLDGDAVKLNDVIKDDDNWWKPTGRPVHYYYSEDMKTFRRVQCSMYRNKIVSAKLTVAKRQGAGTEQKDVPLSKVYKACRYYSHWSTCTSFHRVITVMTRANERRGDNTLAAGGGGGAANLNLRRIFVQFLWRDAKETDKSKVALEYAGTVMSGSASAGGGGEPSTLTPNLASPVPIRKSLVAKRGGRLK